MYGQLSADLYIRVFEHEKACKFKDLSADLASSFNISKLGVLDKNGEWLSDWVNLSSCLDCI